MHSIESWCAEQLHLPPNELTIQPLTGDAGFRRYYRVRSGNNSTIAVDAPPHLINNRAFVSLAKQLRAGGVNTPEILAFEPESGFLLLEDLGSTHLLDVLKRDNVEQHYRQAFDTLQKIHACDRETLPPYTVEKLREEMQLFPEWCLEKNVGYQLNSVEQALCEETWTAIIGALEEQPTVFVHRDYHSRNLLLTDAELGVIDFQDAVRGPLCYDIVSLLKDCYVRWPRDLILNLLRQYWSSCIKQAEFGLQEMNFPQFLRWFDLTGAQRHLKVMGLFCRLSLRDGKHGYLADLPRVNDYLLEVLELYPETRAFGRWYAGEVQSLLRKQSWWPA